MDLGISTIILWVGIAITLVMLTKTALRNSVVPAVVGFILIGFVFRLIDTQWSVFSERNDWLFRVLAEFGIFSLLFRIGLESNIKGLLSQLKNGSVIWAFGVLTSGVMGFVTAFYALNIELIPSLFIATAMTATSVGVPIGVWKSKNAMQSQNGELLLDVAEMDDISGVMLMTLLFAITPVLHQNSQVALLPLIGKELGVILIKFTLFAGACALFSLYIEEHITRFFDQKLSKPHPMLVMVGIGFTIAATAGLLGFSIAIGAFFAGLAFSRDPQKVKMDHTFKTLYELFTPFFFLGIGFNIAPESLQGAVGLGAVLFAVAVIGKLLGHGVPASWRGGWKLFLLFGVSLLPRAEITMIIMERGKNFGHWAVTPRSFTAMVFVSLATCIVAPIVMQALLQKWPQTEGES